VYITVFAALLVTLGASTFADQATKSPVQVAAELIQSLQNEEHLAAGTCGSRGNEYLNEQTVAVKLVALGDSALPFVEDALTAIETHNGEWPYVNNAWWLLHAYARLKGPAALPVFVPMLGNAKLQDLRGAVDDSIALALGLTSVVDSAVRPAPDICGYFERRDGLDLVIFSWEIGDQGMLRAHLGPQAVIALDALLKGRSWQDLPHELWRGKPGRDVAVAYRFEIPPPWAEPVEALENEAERDVRRKSASLAGDAVINTVFTDSSGKECGRHSIAFALTSPRSMSPEDFEGPGPYYFVDNSDLVDLFHVISACAAQ